MASRGIHMIIATDGRPRWFDEKGRFAKAPTSSAIISPKAADYVKREMIKAGHLYGSEAMRALSKMAQDFLDSYVMPEDTGNLKESTSIAIVQARGKDDSQRTTRYISNISVSRPQHWGNWSGIEKGKGRGEDYRWDADDVQVSPDITELDLTVMLRIGIPYSVPLNQLGAWGQHKGFFRKMSAAFKREVYKISEETAKNLHRKKLVLDEDGFYIDPELRYSNQ